MLNKKSFIMLSAHIIVIVTILLLFISSIGYVTDRSFLNTVTYIETVTASINNGPEEVITLPHTFKNLKPRTYVVLKANITIQPDDTVYMKSVYSPARIYANNKLIYKFGDKDEYPKFMIDPATETHIIELTGFDKNVEFKMEFLSPIARDSMTIHPPMLGTTKNVIFNLFHKLGTPLLFSIMQIIIGVSLILLSIFIIFIDKKGSLFLWLGLFSFTTGIWAFGENSFTNLNIKNPTFLYLLAFSGLLTYIIPLLRFVRTIIDFKNSKIIWYIEVFMTYSVGVAFLLQFTRIIALSKSVYFFHIINPIVLLALTWLTIREYVKFKNISAKRFILPIMILSLSAFIEFLNYIFSFTHMSSSIFQTGTILFIAIMGAIAGFTIKDSIKLKNQQKELAFEKNLIDIQAQEQEHRDILLMEHKKLLSQQRHDLRHQLTVIQGLADEKNKALLDYLDELIENIPKAPSAFCENNAVNAVVSHYFGVCKEKNIKTNIKISVPEDNPDILDGNLCSVFGNLLENAIEACDRMTEGDKFINLSATEHYNTLIITMDNSFNGKIKMQNNRFFSSKRDAYGIGLSSISSIAKNAHGSAEFNTEKNVFHSSVYFKL